MISGVYSVHRVFSNSGPGWLPAHLWNLPAFRPDYQHGDTTKQQHADSLLSQVQHLSMCGFSVGSGRKSPSCKSIGLATAMLCGSSFASPRAATKCVGSLSLAAAAAAVAAVLPASASGEAVTYNLEQLRLNQGPLLQVIYQDRGQPGSILQLSNYTEI